MKRVINSIIATAMFGLAAVSFQSCQKEIIPEETTTDNNKLTATIGGPGTKTDYNYNEDGDAVVVTWKKGDKIMLHRQYDADQNQAAAVCEFAIADYSDLSENNKRAVFSLTGERGKPAENGIYTSATFNYKVAYIAVYPSTVQLQAYSVNSNQQDQKEKELQETYNFLAANKPQAQYGNDNMKHLKDYDYLKGIKATNQNNIIFYRKVAVLKVKVTVPDADKDRIPQSLAVSGLWEGNASYEVSLNNVTFDSANSIIAYVTVPPVANLAGKTLSIELQASRNGSNMKKLTASHPFTSGTYDCGGMYACTFTIDAEKPSFEMNYIDLGLPSGTLWAKENLGATSSNPEGHYFQWGEVNGFKRGSDIRMEFKGIVDGKATYSEVPETISKESCALNSVTEYSYLHTTLNFPYVSFTLRKSTNPRVNYWLTSNPSYTNIPDYQGVVSDYNYSQTSTTYEYTATTSNSGTQYGLVNGEYVELKYYNYVSPITRQPAGWYYDNSSTARGKQYTSTRYTRTEKTETVQLSKKVGDAARYQWGTSWHMPTAEQLQELLLYCDRTQVQEGSRYYQKFTRRKISGETGTEDYCKDIDWDNPPYLTIQNSTGWEEGWKDPRSGECRLQTTTAAKAHDAGVNTNTSYSSNYGYCWELHYANQNDDPYKLGLHTHHVRATALPIRPVFTKKKSEL